MKIGDVVENRFQLYICKFCDCPIDNIGCTYECSHDRPLDERDPSTVKVRIWNRRDTLIDELPYLES